MPNANLGPCSQCSLSDARLPLRGRICVDCRRRNGREHYRLNREYYVEKARRRRRAAVTQAREWILAFLQTHPCLDCGTSDTRVLTFDHRDARAKRSDVSALVAEGYSLSAIMREVAQCDVRCANCHLIRTRDQRGWWLGSEWRARQDSNLQPSDP